MVEIPSPSESAFAKANNFNELLDNLIPLLSSRLGGKKVGDIMAYLTIYNLVSLRKRIFSFEEYKLETTQFDGERSLPRQKVENMLNAVRDIRLIYSDNRNRWFIKRRFYRKLYTLADEYDKQQAEEIALVSNF